MNYELSLEMPSKVFRGDSITIYAQVNADITNHIIRAELFDGYVNSIKLINSLISGEEADIEITDAENGEFVIKIAKNLTNNFQLNSYIEIEIENVSGEVQTLYYGRIVLNDQQIDWETI